MLHFDHINLDDDSEVLGQHFQCCAMIKENYPKRDKVPSALASAIAACKKQIEIAPYAARAFRRKHSWQELPDHTGFRQLSIILAHQDNYEEAISLCEQARDQGWTQGCSSIKPDWDRRIERYRKSLNKLQKKEGKSVQKTRHQDSCKQESTHIEFQCPLCTESLRIPKQFVGMTGQCKKCQGKIRISLPK